LFRRFPPNTIINDIALAVSFDRKNSSVLRSLFSVPDDARWTGAGTYQDQHGVISFPADVYDGTKWESAEEPKIEVRITVFHDPLQCNYAHCDFHFYQDGEEIMKITRTSVKMRIRDLLRPLIEREL